MGNDPIKALMAEHEVIVGAQEVIAALENAWNLDAQRYESELEELVFFFRKYCDGFHHRKEEEILFPALMNNQEFVPVGLLEELEEHHRTFRQQVTTIEAALLQKNYEGAHTELKGYFNHLLDHISVENDELFVMAESLFSPEDLEKIYFRFMDLDLELGESLKRDLESRLARLKGFA